MQFSKLYRCKWLVFVVLSLLVVSCANTLKKQESGKSGGTLRLAVFRYTFDDYIFPPTIGSELEKCFASMFYTGLFKINPVTVEVENALCRNWEVDNSGLVYTFYLDTTAQFNKDDCFGRSMTRKVTAYDVKYTFHLLANPHYSTANFTNTVYRIQGAKEYFSMTDEQRDTSRIAGIKVIDDHTLTVTLDKPSAHFLQNLAYPAASIIPFEAVEKYGMESTVNVGPFSYEHDSVEFRFIKSTYYFEKDDDNCRLPYLDSVRITKVKTLDDEVDLFVNNEIDAILLIPGEKVPAIVASFPAEMEYEISDANGITLYGAQRHYNITRKYVKNLCTNHLNILGLDKVYIDKQLFAKKQEN
ncbi:MAG: ABC transporter substrate-binding protein [Bacteroidales bacterium]|nr:ABC transporter substrate-binding protein [Bacteroidales bacterium]